jgi:tetratricopeptide (TPR) repeat protein
VKKTIPHILDAVDELLRKRLFKEAITMLGGIDLESISPDKKAYCDLLFVEANLYLTNYEITDKLEKVVAYYRAGIDNNKFARAKFLQGWSLTALGKFIEAKEVLLESYVHYKRSNNLRGQARALNRLGYVTYIIGDVNAAVARLRECLDIYQEIGDVKNKAIVVLNLAQLLYASGDLTASISLYESSKSAILKRGAWSICAFHNMIAIPYALQGNMGKAESMIHKAIQYLNDYPREKAIYYENLGWIHLLEEDYKNAEKALHKGLKISLEIAPESALVSQIKRRLADAYYGLEKYDLAKKYAVDRCQKDQRTRRNSRLLQDLCAIGMQK